MSAKELKQWLDSLPTDNVLETVHQLREAIETFNEIQVEDAKRIKLLELYKETLDLILYSYDEMRLRQLPIPTIQRKSLAEDIMWLYLGLSNGYKTVVLHSHENQLMPSQDTKILLAVYRAMELIIHALIYAFRSQHTAPPLAYLELNQLYFFAEQDEALALAVKGVRGHAVTPSIDVLFKQFMLLIVADPTSIKHTRLYQLHSALETFTTNCTVLKGYQDKNSPYKYRLDLMDDTPPGLSSNDNTTFVSDTVRTLDIYPALSDIETWITTHLKQTTNYFDEHELHLLEEYLSSVNNIWALKNINLPTSSLVSLTMGATNIRHLLKETSLAVGNYNTPQHNMAAAHANWQVIDKQLKKITIQGQFSHPTDSPLNGDIVGLLSTEQDTGNPEITIASILETTKNHSASTTLKLQLINHNPTPVTCQLLDENGQSLSNIGAFYFQRDSIIKKPASLLTPKIVAEHKHRILVTVHGIIYDVIPTTLVHQTAQYIQFRFKAEKSKGL